MRFSDPVGVSEVKPIGVRDVPALQDAMTSFDFVVSAVGTDGLSSTG